jgi:periplasmic protein TonB
MKITSVHQPPSTNQRRSIAALTATFVMVSAVLHFVLGGMIRVSWVHEPAEQRPTKVSIDTLVTPPPTPTPTPRPSAEPSVQPLRKPQVAQRQPSIAQKALMLAPVHAPVVSATGSAPQITALPAQDESQSVQPQTSPTPMDARDIIISARFIKRVGPIYPDIAIQQAAEGTVIILVTIGPDGTAGDVRVWQSSGIAALDRAALQAAEQSTYAPPEVNGEPATQTYRIIYTFYLN